MRSVMRIGCNSFLPRSGMVSSAISTISWQLSIWIRWKTIRSCLFPYQKSKQSVFPVTIPDHSTSYDGEAKVGTYMTEFTTTEDATGLQHTAFRGRPLDGRQIKMPKVTTIAKKTSDRSNIFRKFSCCRILHIFVLSFFLQSWAFSSLGFYGAVEKKPALFVHIWCDQRNSIRYFFFRVFLRSLWRVVMVAVPWATRARRVMRWRWARLAADTDRWLYGTGTRRELRTTTIQSQKHSRYNISHPSWLTITLT